MTVWRCFLVASRSMSRISSISSVNGSSFDGHAEAVVVHGRDQAEVRASLTVLQVTPYLHCNTRFDDEHQHVFDEAEDADAGRHAPGARAA